MSEGSDIAPFVVGILILFGVIVVLLLTALQVLVCCKICSKAGFSWALDLLVLLPIANVVLFFYLGFAEWPVQKELRELKVLQTAP